MRIRPAQAGDGAGCAAVWAGWWPRSMTSLRASSLHSPSVPFYEQRMAYTRRAVIFRKELS